MRLIYKRNNRELALNELEAREYLFKKLSLALIPKTSCFGSLCSPCRFLCECVDLEQIRLKDMPVPVDLFIYLFF